MVESMDIVVDVEEDEEDEGRRNIYAVDVTHSEHVTRLYSTVFDGLRLSSNTQPDVLTITLRFHGPRPMNASRRSRIGADQFVARIARLREDDRFKDAGPDVLKFPELDFTLFWPRKQGFLKLSLEYLF